MYINILFYILTPHVINALVFQTFETCYMYFIIGDVHCIQFRTIKMHVYIKLLTQNIIFIIYIENMAINVLLLSLVFVICSRSREYKYNLFSFLSP